jgi:Glyoxalase-like domain
VTELPRLRQAVLAARSLDPVVDALRGELGLGEAFNDPGVGHFGLRNAVFALGDTFLEVVSPVRDGTAAGRLLDRRGGDCGYMLMFQVPALAPARARVADAGVREVFEVSLPEIAEVHLHPGDMRGAIVSLSEPEPPESWLWGGPGWAERSAPARISGAVVGVRDAPAVAARWRSVIGGAADVEVIEDPDDRGLLEVRIAGAGRRRDAFSVAGVRFLCEG